MYFYPNEVYVYVHMIMLIDTVFLIKIPKKRLHQNS
jgi:hypothetical protein